MKKLLLPVLSVSLLLAACGGGGTPQPADTTAPTVTLDASRSNTTVNLSATATDNVKVIKVEFYRGNTLISTDDSAPYSATTTVSATDNGNVTYTAKAYDAAGNVGQGSKVVTVSATPKTTAYQGQYYWALFTNPSDPEGSLIAEGAAIFDSEFTGTDGQTLGSGAYAKVNPKPEMLGEALVGLIALDGKNELTTAFFQDTTEVKSYLIGIDSDGSFSPSTDGRPIFTGEGATFNTSGAVTAEGYFGMLRVNADPNAKNTSITSKAKLMRALNTSSSSKFTLNALNAGHLKKAAAQIELQQR